MTPSPATPVGHPHGGAHHAADDEPKLFGLLAEFPDADALVVATRKARAEGYTLMDTHTPYPVGDAADALGFPKSEMGVVMFIGGLTGACAGFLMQYWDNSYGYSLNIGGRPYLSWPSFIPITFEMMVLTASLSGLFGLMALCGLPRLHHPLFNSKTFDRASRDRFFLSLEAADPKFDLGRAKAFLQGLNPSSPVEEVFE
ncbi:MAG: hypothetical protein JWO38_1970 [Gemmataceae bacterium]|nr:hypothetical protein [Gemmataceae bacterium]